MSELKLTQQQIDSREWDNNGTAITGHEEFDKNGYLVVKDLIDVTEFNDVFPEPMGKYEWFDDNIDNFNHESDEGQVHGCTSRRNYPPHKPLHDKIGRKLEKILGRKLYPTYQFDRFYSTGQQLWTHLDRDTCEISCTIHINTNVRQDWPIWIKLPDTYDNPVYDKRNRIIKKGEYRSVSLQRGDGMIYKGCERPHWRNQLQKESVKVYDVQYSEMDSDEIYTVSNGGQVIEKEGLYYHQIFMHWVLADGLRAYKAFGNDDGNDASFWNVNWDKYLNNHI